MNPVNNIAELFSNCSHEAFSRMSLDDLMSGEYDVGFTSLDFFSIEPFAQYLKHWPSHRCQIHLSVDELDTTVDGVYLLAMQNRQLVAVKNLLGDSISYDTAAYQIGEWQCRHKIYRNAEGLKPIEIELLKKDEHGYPISFIIASEYGLKVGHYEWLQDCVRITEQSAVMPEVGSVPELKPYAELTVEFDDAGQVVRIRHLNRDSILYDAGWQELTLEDKLNKASHIIHTKILADLKATPLLNTVSCFLFEYSEQGPLPPTIALIQPHEVVIQADEYPLMWLNAPDCELFTEVDFDSIRLHGEHDALFDAINADFEELDYADANTLMFTFYIELSRRLEKSLKEGELLKITADFFVTAREFSQCNEAEFLQTLWPSERWLPMADALEAFEKIQREKIEAYLQEQMKGDA